MKKVLNNLEEYILIVLFPTITVLVFVATMFRYLNLGSIPWSEELARYIMIWIGYVGASLGVKRNAHLGVEILVNKLPGKSKIVSDYLRFAIILFFNILIIVFSYKIMMYQIKMSQISPALAVPIWIPYLAVPFGAIMMSIRSIQGFINNHYLAEK